MPYIYQILHPDTMTPMYVGSTLNMVTRMKTHNAGTRLNVSLEIQKLKSEGKYPLYQILKEVDVANRNSEEQKYIKELSLSNALENINIPKTKREKTPRVPKEKHIGEKNRAVNANRERGYLPFVFDGVSKKLVSKICRNKNAKRAIVLGWFETNDRKIYFPDVVAMIQEHFNIPVDKIFNPLTIPA